MIKKNQLLKFNAKQDQLMRKKFLQSRNYCQYTSLLKQIFLNSETMPLLLQINTKVIEYTACRHGTPKLDDIIQINHDLLTLQSSPKLLKMSKDADCYILHYILKKDNIYSELLFYI